MKIQKEELSEVFYIDYETFKDMIKFGSDEVVFEWDKITKSVFKLLDKIIYGERRKSDK